MNYWKLGCNWGSGKPDFYEMIKSKSFVICWEYPMSIGDVVAVCKGHKVHAIAIIVEDRKPCTSLTVLEEEFKKYQIDFTNKNNVARASYYELPSEKQFEYKLQQGICQIQKDEIIKKIDSLIKQQKMEENIKKIRNLLTSNHNLILTGSPGTGKTYLAKQIAEHMNAEVGFVQFHPSYDYTDFVEGLRPTQSGENENIGFERKDGVFKAFCAQALENLIDSQKSSQETNDDAVFKKSYEVMIDKIRNNEVKEIPLRSDTMSMEIVDVSDNDNIILKAKGTESGRTYTISYNRLRKLSLVYKNIDALNSISNIYRAVTDVIGGCHSSAYWATLYFLYRNYMQHDSVKVQIIERKNYVFIIDEINRGEISKIFGELFFSIDPGYRGENGKVKTQYQNLIEDGDIYEDGFYVPDNVYIIGTMNDIDRSVESMDFAFRRRFAFKEIKASENIGMLDEIGSNKDEAIKHMERINKAINEIGLNDAYHIGGAYFLKLNNYKDETEPFTCLWNNHLEPLLKEYLRGNAKAGEHLKKLKTAYDG